LALRGTSDDGSERGNSAQPMRPLLPLRTAVTVSVTGRHCAAVEGTGTIELAEVYEVVIELYYQEVGLVLGNIYANMLSAYPRD
jgi:hypothetical protein